MTPSAATYFDLGYLTNPKPGLISSLNHNFFHLKFATLEFYLGFRVIASQSLF